MTRLFDIASVPHPACLYPILLRDLLGIALTGNGQVGIFLKL